MAIDLTFTGPDRERLHKQIETLSELATRTTQEALRGPDFRKASEAIARFADSQAGQTLKRVQASRLRSLKGPSSKLAESLANDLGRVIAESVLPDLSRVFGAGVPAVSTLGLELPVAVAPPSIQKLGSLIENAVDAATKKPEGASPSPRHPPPSPKAPGEFETNAPFEATAVGIEDEPTAFSSSDLLLSLAIRLPRGIVNVISTVGPNGLVAITDGQAIGLAVTSVQSVLVAIHRIEEIDGAIKLLGVIGLGRTFFQKGAPTSK